MYMNEPISRGIRKIVIRLFTIAISHVSSNETLLHNVENIATVYLERPFGKTHTIVRWVIIFSCTGFRDGYSADIHR